MHQYKTKIITAEPPPDTAKKKRRRSYLTYNSKGEKNAK
jgi:hypothetical protein